MDSTEYCIHLHIFMGFSGITIYYRYQILTEDLGNNDQGNKNAFQKIQSFLKNKLISHFEYMEEIDHAIGQLRYKLTTISYKVWKAI